MRTVPPPVEPPRAEIERYVLEMARRVGLLIQSADLPVVVTVFGELERNAAALMLHELPEWSEAAPVFRIP